jgi:hypothetical protein
MARGINFNVRTHENIVKHSPMLLFLRRNDTHFFLAYWCTQSPVLFFILGTRNTRRLLFMTTVLIYNSTLCGTETVFDRNWQSNLFTSPWARGLRSESTAAQLLGLRVRISPGTWMYVCCESGVLSGRGQCNGPIISPEESYRVWCVWMPSWKLTHDES